MCLFELWFSQGMCLVVGLLCPMVVLVSQGNSILFPFMAVSVSIPTNSGFPFFTPPQAFIVYRFFVDGHFDRFPLLIQLLLFSLLKRKLLGSIAEQGRNS